MECFSKLVKSCNYFSKVLYLTSLTGFRIYASLSKYSLNCRIISGIVYILYETYSEPCPIQNHSYYRKFRHIQAYSRPFKTYSAIMRHIQSPLLLFAFLEPCHIQNLGIFRAPEIFTALSRHILAYSERCVTLKN